ncbi:major facilitator superfamily domain-containing protein 6-A [Bacillus rossius redtenbacheri]|uniref:major facilitator superfamily domain-containing protein 6-A n=1 Tax=Bacillus rossius redtenbacheri TaxID=93214 RepID=UPI002FDE1816
MSKMVHQKINMQLLPMKGHFFLFSAGTAPIVPFITVYARQLGFSSVVVGTMYTILPVCGMLAKPLFGAAADHFRLQKFIFLLFQVVTLLAFFAIKFIPELPNQSFASLDCDSLTVIKACNNASINQCTLDRFQSEENDASVVFCQLECYAQNSSFVEELCFQWKIQQYCESGSSSVAESHLLHGSTNLNVPVRFKAEVPLKHTVQNEGCLYFRVNATYFDGTHAVPYCNKLTSVKCNIACYDETLNEVLKKPTGDDFSVSSFYQFWLFFLLLILSWVGMAVVTSVGDAICFGLLGDRPSDYGNQRLWGAVGWGIFSFASGALVDEFSVNKVNKDYSAMFYLMAIMIILDFVVSLKIKHTQTKLSNSIVRDVGGLICDVRICVFLLWCIAVGICTGLLWQFLFWHLEDLVEGCSAEKWIKTLEGLVSAVQCFGGEIPFFFLSGSLLQRIGHVNAMSLVLAAFGVRFMLYSYLTNPWWCLPIELLQGVTFGLFYSTMASYASIITPPGTDATIQGLVGAIFEGVGVSVGSLLGGVLFKYGGAFAFRVYGIGALILFVIHVVVQHFIPRKTQYSVQPKDLVLTAHYTTPADAVHMLEEQ